MMLRVCVAFALPMAAMAAPVSGNEGHALGPGVRRAVQKLENKYDISESQAEALRELKALEMQPVHELALKEKTSRAHKLLVGAQNKQLRAKEEAEQAAKMLGIATDDVVREQSLAGEGLSLIHI